MSQFAAMRQFRGAGLEQTAQTNLNWKMLWHGNECGKNKSNENFKTTVPSNNYDRPKTTGECGMF